MSLARLAAESVAQCPTATLTPGPGSRWLTSEGSDAIRGVVASVQPDGRYELELHLVVAWPPGPLTLLAGQLRCRLHAASQAAGLEGQLGQMQIYIDGVQDPEDRASARELA